MQKEYLDCMDNTGLNRRLGNIRSNEGSKKPFEEAKEFFANQEPIKGVRLCRGLTAAAQ